ncbi:MAG TPA: hypothetical protein DDX54_00635 [Rhodospirillaceae bacterium]|jgi:hypothetical protein|nr:hypothetical protein [Rhodospirillaceae bacterium]
MMQNSDMRARFPGLAEQMDKVAALYEQWTARRDALGVQRFWDTGYDELTARFEAAGEVLDQRMRAVNARIGAAREARCTANPPPTEPEQAMANLWEEAQMVLDDLSRPDGTLTPEVATGELRRISEQLEQIMSDHYAESCCYRYTSSISCGLPDRSMPLGIGNKPTR